MKDGIKVIDGFVYGGEEYLDKRMSVATLQELYAISPNTIPNGFSVFVESEGIWYLYHAKVKGSPQDKWKPCISDEKGDDSHVAMSQRGIKTLLLDKMGAENGLATLDGAGHIPASQLPSYVDDVIEYERRDQFPFIAESGKIYVAKDTNLTYRWSGTTYIPISSPLALGETDRTAYPGNKGKKNADDIVALQEELGKKVNTADLAKINGQPVNNGGQNIEIPLYNDALIKEGLKAVEAQAAQNKQDILTKQEQLASGKNIKTVNGESLLGGGDIPFIIGDTEQQVLVGMLATLDERLKALEGRVALYGDVKVNSITTANIPMVCGRPIIIIATDVPSATTIPERIGIPDFQGQIFIDTTHKKVYSAVGTSSISDWVILN